MAIDILCRSTPLTTIAFRGAGETNGKTSWTAKPELADYVSFYGFMIYYLHGLELSSPTAKSSQIESSDVPLSPIQSSIQSPPPHIEEGRIRLCSHIVLGGYSYGSLIASHLPPVSNILSLFSSASKGSAEAEIRLRASHLSIRWNRRKQSNSNRPTRDRSLKASGALRRGASQSIAVGGQESEEGSRRVSRESRRSLDFEGIRRSIDKSRKRFTSRHESSEEDMTQEVEKVVHEEVSEPDIRYLLISPLLPPISKLASMFSRISFSGRSKLHTAHDSPLLKCEPEKQLTSHPTLAVYGNKDFFTSHKKLRKWVESLASQQGSKFRFVEVDGAGHFWHEDGAEKQMKAAVREWIRDR